MQGYKTLHQIWNQLEKNDIRTAIVNIHTLHVQDNSLTVDILSLLYLYLIKNPDTLDILFCIAELLFHARRYPETLVELKEILTLEPNHTQTYLMLGKLYKKQFSKIEIQAIFETAFSKDILDSTVLDLLPGMYLDQHDLPKSIAFYEKLITHFPETLHFQKNLAELYERAKLYPQATQIYTQLAEKNPSMIPKATSFCEKACEQYPENLEIRKHLITLHTQNLNPSQAVKHLQAVIDYDPGFTAQAAVTCKELLSIYPGTPDILIGLAHILIRLQHYSEGVTCTRSVFEQDPNHPEIRPILNKILNEYPQQVMALQLAVEVDIRTQNIQTALDTIQSIIELNHATEEIPIEKYLKNIILQNPNFAIAAQLKLTYFLFNQKSWIKAATEAQRLWHTDADSEARLISIQIQRELQQESEAFTQTFNALEKYPYSSQFHDQLRALHRQYFQTQRQQLFSKTENGLLTLAQLNLRHGEWITAMTLLQKIPPQHDHYLCAQYSLNYCFLQMGRYDLSIQQLTRLLNEIGPSIQTSNTIRYLLGISYLHLAMPLEASSHIEKIVEFDIAFPHLQSTLAWCQEQGATPQIKTLSLTCTPYNKTVSPLLIRSPLKANIPPLDMTLSFSHSHNNQGVDHVIRGNLTAALEAFQMALQLDPNFAPTQINLGILSLLKGNIDQAKTWLKPVSDQSEFAELMTLNIALLTRLEGNPKKSIETLQGLKNNWNHPLIDLHLGDSYSQVNELEKATLHWKNTAKNGWLYFHLLRRLHYLYPAHLSDPNWVISFAPTFPLPPLKITP